MNEMRHLLVALLFALSGCVAVRQPEIQDFAQDKVTIKIPANLGDYAANNTNPEEKARIQAEADRVCGIYGHTASQVVSAECGKKTKNGFFCREWHYSFACTPVGGLL